MGYILSVQLFLDTIIRRSTRILSLVWALYKKILMELLTSKTFLSRTNALDKPFQNMWFHTSYLWRILIFLFRRNRHFHTHLGHNHATMGLDVAKSILNVFGFIVLQVPRDISAANLIPLLMPYKYRTSYFSTHALANVINLICENYKQKVILVFRHGTIFETCKNFLYNGFLTSSAHGVLKWSNI